MRDLNTPPVHERQITSFGGEFRILDAMYLPCSILQGRLTFTYFSLDRYTRGMHSLVHWVAARYVTFLEILLLILSWRGLYSHFEENLFCEEYRDSSS